MGTSPGLSISTGATNASSGALQMSDETTLVSEGPFLGGGGTTLFIPGAIDNIGGSASDNADTLLTAISGVSGSGTLATFDFTALAPGGSSLSAFNVILFDSSLSGIDAAVTNASVTVPGSAVPEPRYAGLIACGLLLFFCLSGRRLVRPNSSPRE